MRLVAALTLSLALVAPKPAEARKQPCKTRACKARVAHRQCSQTKPRACVWHVIHHARLAGTWKAAWLLRVPSCESTWNPYAVSAGGHKGLYQFDPGTWAGTPYGHRSIFSAFWQPYAAAWMLRQGRVGEWSCV